MFSFKKKVDEHNQEQQDKLQEKLRKKALKEEKKAEKRRIVQEKKLQKEAKKKAKSRDGAVEINGRAVQAPERLNVTTDIKVFSLKAIHDEISVPLPTLRRDQELIDRRKEDAWRLWSECYPQDEAIPDVIPGIEHNSSTAINCDNQTKTSIQLSDEIEREIMLAVNDVSREIKASRGKE